MEFHPCDPLAYYTFRDRLALDIRLGRVRPRAADLTEHAAGSAGISVNLAADLVAKFLDQLGRDVARRPRFRAR